MSSINPVYTITREDYRLIEQEEAPYSRLHELVEMSLLGKMPLYFDLETTRANFLKLVIERVKESTLIDKIQETFNYCIELGKKELIKLTNGTDFVEIPFAHLAKVFPYFKTQREFNQKQRDTSNCLDVKLSRDSLEALSSYLRNVAWEFKSSVMLDELINFAEMVQNEEFGLLVADKTLEFLATPNNEAYFDDKYIPGRQDLFIERFAQKRAIPLQRTPFTYADLGIQPTLKPPSNITIYSPSRNRSKDIEPKMVISVAEFKKFFGQVTKPLLAFLIRHLPPLTLKLDKDFNPASLSFLPNKISLLIEAFVFDADATCNFAEMPESTCRTLLQKFPDKKIYPLIPMAPETMELKIGSETNLYALMLLLGSYKNLGYTDITKVRQLERPNLSKPTHNYLRKLFLEADATPFKDIAIHYMHSMQLRLLPEEMAILTSLLDVYPHNKFLLWTLGNYTKKIENLKEAHQLGPDNCYILELLLEASIRANQFEGLKALALQAYSLQPNNRNVIKSLAEICLWEAEKSSDLQHINEAEQFALQLRLERSVFNLNRKIYFQQAVLLKKANRYQEALAAFKQAELHERSYSVDPNGKPYMREELGQILYQKALILLKLNQKKKAFKLFGKAEEAYIYGSQRVICFLEQANYLHSENKLAEAKAKLEESKKYFMKLQCTAAEKMELLPQIEELEKKLS